MDYLRYYLGTAFMAAGLLGFALGGSWVWLGASTFLALVVLDLVFWGQDLAERDVAIPWLADLPLYLHGPLLVALVGAAAWRLRVPAGAPLPPLSQMAGCMLSVAWLGVIPSLPVMHELIHRRSPLLRFYGFLMSVTVAEPMRRLAHLRTHHVHFGSEDDSDTARRGETLYGFIVRAAVSGTREAFHSEGRRLAAQGLSLWSWRSELVRSLMLVVATLLTLGLLAGPVAVGVLGLAFLITKVLLESFNYLQHYGLVRVKGARAGTRHVWNHLSPVARVAAFEITNHAPHHMDQQVPFYRLKPDPTAPQMPSVVLCFLSALVPPLWTRLIAMPRLRHWDQHFATAEERALAAQANAAAGWPDWLGAPEQTPERAALSAESGAATPAV